jgi:hypothetical protein
MASEILINLPSCHGLKGKERWMLIPENNSK